MAQWKETLEPYVKVIESVKTTTSNPTVSTGLIVGAALISDTGSATPTLITSQKEFLANFATKEISEAYMKEIDALYVGEQGSNMASTMWLNAYRLAGSTNLLISRAVNGKDVIYAKDLTNGSNDYILRDSEILKKAAEFKLVKDKSNPLGWLFIISEVGAFGNLVDQDKGPQYDYDVYNIPDLVTKLNETSKFFSPKYSFYTDAKATAEHKIEISSESTADQKDSVMSVVFEEVYLAPGIMDKSDSRGGGNGFAYMFPATKDWQPSSPGEYPIQECIDLNENPSYAKFTAPEYYVTNLNNSNTDLCVRIRKFNHNAVVQKVTSSSDESPWTVIKSVLDLYMSPGHPTPSEKAADFYEVAVKDPSLGTDWYLFNVGNKPAIGDVTTAEVNAALGMMQIKFPDDLSSLGLDYYGYSTDNFVELGEGTTTPELPAVNIEKYTVASVEKTVKGVVESINDLPSSGHTLGDLYLVAKKKMYYKTVNEVETIPSSGVVLDPTNFIGSPISTQLNSIKIGEGETAKTYVITKAVKELSEIELTEENLGKYFAVCTVTEPASEGQPSTWATITKIVKVTEDTVKWYQVTKALEYKSPDKVVDINARIVTGTGGLSLLNVTKSTILQAWDAIQEDERYIVEGATDLGCTDTLIQNYIANIANSDEGNYFYPVSTANTTNYMSIANHKSKITTHSHKEYFLSPWDYDSGTTGFLFNVSPATLYWELIASNKKNNQEFAAAFSQTNGIITPVRLAKEFTKKERQLLLTKNINTIYHDLYLERYYINDNKTDYVGDETVLGEECNARFQIRISKALKQSLLPQFRGKQSNATTWANVRDVINYWFKFTVLGYGSTIAEWNVICDASNNTDEDIRAHRLNVKVQVRFQSSAKYITVYNDAYPIGLEFEAE